jgi:hypothetical protein
MKKLVLSTLFMAIAASVYCQTQMTLPVSFQETNVTYNLVGFEGAEASSIVTDPTDAQNTVGRVIKSATAQTYAGTSITDVVNNVQVGFSTAVPFSATTKQMTVRVWSPDAAIPVRLKVEDHLDPTHSVETEAVTTVAGQWETLTFDFANQAPGTAELNLSYVFDKATIFFNFGTNGATAGEKTYYFDDVQMGTGVSTGPYNITFQVDMASVPGAITPYVNGPFNGWCGNCAPMTQVGSTSKYQLTIPLQPGVIEYKFSHDNVSDWETLLAGSSCTVTAFGFTNRTFTVTQDAVLPDVCYGSCDACDSTNNGPFNVTFKVDMNQSGQTFTTPEVNGTFNNWCGACAPLSDVDGDNIWELTIPLQADTFEYKFAYDNWANGGESLVAGSSCTITTIDGGNTYTNRLIIVSAETVLDAVCWASCSPCATGIETSEKSNKGITAFPNPANDLLFFNGSSIVGTTSVRIFNCIGSLVASKQFQSLSNASVDIADLKNGVYFIEIENNNSTSTQKVVVQH